MKQHPLLTAASPVVWMIPAYHETEEPAQILAAMQSLVIDTPVALEIAGTSDQRRFLMRARQQASLLHVETQLRARYPQAQFVWLAPDDDPLCLRSDEGLTVVELKAGSPSYLPLHTWQGRENEGNDPVLGILAALDALPEGTRAMAQLVLLPAAPNWSKANQRKAVEHALEPERADTALRHRPDGGGPSAGLLVSGGLLLAALLLYGRFKQSIPSWVLPALGQVLHGSLPHLTPAQRMPFAGLLALPVGALLLFVLLDQLRRRLVARPLYDMKLVGQKTSRMAYRVRLRLYAFGPALPARRRPIRWRRCFQKWSLLDRLIRVRYVHHQPTDLADELTEKTVCVPQQCQDRYWQLWVRVCWGVTCLLSRELARMARDRWQRRRDVTHRQQARQVMLGRLVAAYRQFHLANGNYFVPRRLLTVQARWCVKRWWRAVKRSPHLISVNSLADLWHLPAVAVLPELALVEQRRARTLLIPPVLARVAQEPGATILGQSVHAGHHLPFALPAACLDTHMLIGGKSGEGKSTWIEHLVQAMLRAPGGLVLIDPHGDLVDHLLPLIPLHRMEDVVLVDLSDQEYALGLNPLDVTMGRGRDKAVGDLLNTLAHIWTTSWGPRMENAFEFALRTLYEANRSLVDQDAQTGAIRQYTLLDVMPLLTDESFCHALLEHVDDPFILRWWQFYYDPLSLQMQRDRSDPVLSKVAKFESQIARRIVGQSQSTINFAQDIQQEKIILIKLAKGVVGEDVAKLLGATFLGLLQMALEEQGVLPEEQRKRLPIIVDEFQVLKGVDWSAIAELRKYGAAFSLATQSLEYLRDRNEPILATILANVKQYVLFHLSAQDAETISPEIGVEPEDIVNLEPHTCYIRVTYAGQRQPPFSLQLAPPVVVKGQIEQVQHIRDESRKRHTRPAASIDQELKAAVIRTLAMQPKETASTPVEQPVSHSHDEKQGPPRQQSGYRGRKSQEKRDGKVSREERTAPQQRPMNWTETVGVLALQAPERPAGEEAQDGEADA